MLPNGQFGKRHAWQCLCLAKGYLLIYFLRTKLYCGVTEDKLKALREKSKEREVKEVPKQEPTTEMLFLCSYDGCHKAFLEAPQIRKHLQVHGERQYACHFEGCDKVSFAINI